MLRLARPRRGLSGVALALAAFSIPASAGAVSLVVDRLDTPDVVQAGATVSFSFALQFEPDDVLLATQAEISAPQLADFQFPTKSGITGPNPWDLSSTFRRITADREGNMGNPMWVHAENVFSEDPMGVTWDEVGGLAPLGRFSATATYNGEIEFFLSPWELVLLDGFSSDPASFGTRSHSVPLDPAWAQIRTGVTVVGGLELPPPPPPPPAAPEPPPAVEPPPQDPPPVEEPPRTSDPPGETFDGLPWVISPMPPSSIICGESSSDPTVCPWRHSGIFDPVAADSDPRFHPTSTGGIESAVPEPMTSALILLAFAAIAPLRCLRTRTPAGHRS